MNFQYDEASAQYEKVINLKKSVKWEAESFCELGRCYQKKGDYYKSISFFKRGINILERLNDRKSLNRQYVNLALVYYDINEKESSLNSIQYLMKADSLGSFIQLTPRDYFRLRNSLGNIYARKNLESFDKSRGYFLKNLELSIKDKNSDLIAMSAINLANLYNSVKNDSSSYFTSLGLKYVKNNEAKARLYDNLADYHIIQGDFKEANRSIHSSLEIISDSKINGLPTNYQINKSILKDYTLYCLKKKAEIYIRLFESNLESSQLKNALTNIERAEYVIDLLLNGTSEQSTQKVWRREASQAYLYGAYASHLLGDADQAFGFMEKNKALLLSEGVLKNTEFANLPRHISQQETAFQKDIYELENRLSKDDDNAILQDSLFNAKLTHEKYVDSLKTVYPKYFARKINVEQVSLSDIQKGIGKNEAILSYIWSDFDRDTELVIGLIATKEEAKTFEIKNTQKLREDLKAYRKLISKPFTTKQEQDAFKEVAYQLYTTLVPSEFKELIEGKNLTIIPDGDLQNVPFESLITKPNTNEYLILNRDINYSYSYSFLKHNERVNRKTQKEFIGYSPSQFESLSLSSLKNAEEEVTNINTTLEGIIKLQDTATKEDFLKNSKDSKIIHLATHADVGKNPWIAFADEKLELHELYTYKNNADLVTLSACNTSLGELAKGEGVLSLARGFFYSGSKSVVSSLWEVNDKSTSEIMTTFYKNLKKGQTKSEAINNAKRTYLTNHSLSEQSPYYWSSFILIGDAGTIDLSSNWNLYLIAGIIILLIILFFRKKIKITG